MCYYLQYVQFTHYKSKVYPVFYLQYLNNITGHYNLYYKAILNLVFFFMWADFF